MQKKPVRRLAKAFPARILPPPVVGLWGVIETREEDTFYPAEIPTPKTRTEQGKSLWLGKRNAA